MSPHRTLPLPLPLSLLLLACEPQPAAPSIRTADLAPVDAPACPGGEPPAEATVNGATYQGCAVVPEGDGASPVRAFRGIEYGRADRWQAPSPVVATGAVDATRVGDTCPQYDWGTTQPYNDQTMSEDCLSLNVWTPSTLPLRSGEAARPVFVFIHGGGFLSGAGSLHLYDGAQLAAERGLVVVTFNYRLGVLGFLHQEGRSGNFGLMDQQLALGWVRDHIAGFGGDPARVTLVGESAGAMSVLDQMAAPTAAGAEPLFRQTIAQSSYAGVSSPSAEEAAALEAALVAALPAPCPLLACSTLELMTAQSALLQRLSPLQAMFVFGPALEPASLPAQPISLEARSPVLIGNNRDEATYFVSAYRVPPLSPWTSAELHTFITQIYGPELAPKIEALPRYDADQIEPIDALTNLVADGWFICASDHLLGRSTLPAAAYGYADEDPSSFNFYEGVSPRCHTRVCHGAELPFVFDQPYDVADQPVTFGEGDVAKADTFGAEWAAFADAGRPADALWLPYAGHGRYRLSATERGSFEADTERNCAFWTEEVYAKGGVQGAAGRILASLMSPEGGLSATP